MKKEMLINVLQPEECRIAIIEDGILEELYVERTSHESYTGNIYKGKIVNLEPAIQAAFVDFSVGRNGFLHVSDVEPQYYRSKGGADEAEAPPREREPRRDRERSNDRGRRPRPPEAGAERDPLSPPPSYPEDRARPERPERERPDRSEKGRRDRSERRFGEGLADNEDWHPAPVAPRYPVEPPARAAEPERFERDEPPAAPRRRSEAASIGWSDTPPPVPAPRAPEPPPRSLPPVEEPPRARVPRPPADSYEADLPPSRTHRQRTQVPPPRPPVDPIPEARTRTAPPTRPSFDDEVPRTRVTPPTPAPTPIQEPTSELPPARDRDRDLDRDRDRGPRGRAPRPRTGRPDTRPDILPDSDLPTAPSSPQPSFGESIAPEPGFGDRTEPRRRGGRDAIRSRGTDREGMPPRDRERPAYRAPIEETPAVPVEPPRIERPRPEPRVERPRVIEPERPPIVERPAAPERRRPEADRPSPSARDRDRDREGTRPTDRAGEEGYVPRRQRVRPEESLFEPEPAPAVWPEIEDAHLDDLDLAEGDQDTEGETDADRAGGPRRRRRRRRRREGERPTREAISKAGAGDLDDELDIDETVPPLRGETPHVDDFDFGDDSHDDEDDFDDEEEITARSAPNPEDEIDPELEEEIRKEIEEIAELEREMGLRGTSEARPRRGDDSDADGGRGGKSPRGRGVIKPPIQDIFRRGDEVLIQVIKESIGTKGPTLSTYISIPGRYLVLMPGLNRVGVSRKIADEGQRRKLREIMTELNPPKGLGFIVRTAGLDRSKRDLARDLAYLLRLWKVILRRIKKAKGPTPIYQESDMITRTIRDIFTAEIDTIWIDEPAAFERAQEFLRVVMPRFVNRLKLYDEKVPLFHKYGIEEEIAKIQRRRVDLPEGGSIVIDQTEALVAIDVNSGNFRVENDAERTAYEMNLRAAKEIARQLRLRDLGGVIVNDFIDMRDEKNRRGVEKALRDAIKRDRARTKVLRMSQFGLIEMTRQRIRPSLKRSVYEDCSHCLGNGQVKTVESMSIEVMRLLALSSHRDDIRRVNISVSEPVETYLNNRKRKELSKFEIEANMTILIRGEEGAPPEHLQIDCFDASNNEIRLFPQSVPPSRRTR
jgi:ribonuclease E